MKKVKYLSLGMIVVISMGIAGCASIADINLTKVESTCGQSCTKTYSECVNKFTFFPIMLQHECTDSLRLCAQTCPPRKINE